MCLSSHVPSPDVLRNHSERLQSMMKGQNYQPYIFWSISLLNEPISVNYVMITSTDDYWFWGYELLRDSSVTGGRRGRARHGE